MTAKSKVRSSACAAPDSDELLSFRRDTFVHRLFAQLAGQADLRFGGLQGSDSYSNRHPLKPLPDPQPVEVGAARIISGRFNGSRVFDPLGDFAIEEHDGKIWRPILPAIKNNENPVWSTTFPPVKTKHIRLVITATPHDLSRVWEIEFDQPLTGIKK